MSCKLGQESRDWGNSAEVLGRWEMASRAWYRLTNPFMHVTNRARGEWGDLGGPDNSILGGLQEVQTRSRRLGGVDTDAWLWMPGHGRGSTAVDAWTRGRGVVSLVADLTKLQTRPGKSLHCGEICKLGQESRVTVK